MAFGNMSFQSAELPQSIPGGSALQGADINLGSPAADAPGMGDQVNTELMRQVSDKPSWMYDNVSIEQLQGTAAPPAANTAPRFQPQQQAQPTPQYQQHFQPPAPPVVQADPGLLGRLQYLEAQNSDLRQRAEVATFYDALFQARPDLQQAAASTFEAPPPSNQHEAQNIPQPVQQQQRVFAQAPPQGVPPQVFNKVMEKLEKVQLETEALQLERANSNFDRRQVAQYAYARGIPTLTQAWHQMVGEASLYQAQAAQQQAYQRQQQAYYQQMQQQRQPQYQQQQQFNNPYQQQGYAPGPLAPPPASEAVVTRPTSSMPGDGGDPMDHAVPKSWNDTLRLMQYDMQKAGLLR